MNQRAALNQYRKINTQSAIDHASPHRLVQMLMEGGLQRMAEAKGAIERKTSAEKGEAIGKAISVIGGLRDSLKHEAGGDLPARLDNLYVYMTQRLLEANLKSDSQAIDEVMVLLKTIKEGWDGIADKATHSGTSE